MGKNIKNVTSFIELITLSADSAPLQHFLYRGHSKLEYKVEPSIFRNQKWRQSEHLMIRQMIAENPFDFGKDTTTFDKLVRAQHYGLPTRLLDVSSNPLVGLYFACCSNQTKDGSVLIIRTAKTRHRFYDSHTVSLLANLAFLSRSEKDKLFKYAKEHGHGKTRKERVDAFKGCPELDRLIQTVRSEKPYFREEADPYDLAYVASVTPKKLHDRIKAQEGQFLIFGMNEGTEGAHLENFGIEELKVPSENKKKIIIELALLGISERSLFPEIDKTAMQIKQKYS